MRILFCTPQLADEAGGFSRIQLRLGDELRKMGHEVTILCPPDLGCQAEYQGGRVGSPYAAALRAHLSAHAAGYDVVEYDDEHLPFPRSELDPGVLFVARSVLLVQYLERLRLPEGRTLRELAGRAVRGRQRATLLRERIAIADATDRNADVVNVANPRDRDELVGRGIDRERIAVVPYALASSVRDALRAATGPEPPRRPVVAFVGTFDYRKGATHFAPLLARLVRSTPGVRLRLLGCKGLFDTEARVRAFFPRRLRSRVDVVMTFPREKLGELLSGCSLGVFPSYLESFGLGVLEMMSARLPVVAFDVPGPPVMVPPDLLVPVGDTRAMASIVSGLLRDPSRLRRERERARAIAEGFTWREVARLTVDAYERGRARLTSAHASVGATPALPPP